MNLRDVHDYAWHWFEYHAGQRLTAFRFFLIFLGGLAIAFSTAVESDNLLLARGVGGLGAFVSLAFLVLESRNEALVNLGRSALEVIEAKFTAAEISDSKLKLLTSDKSRSIWSSHKFWFRLIYGVSIIVFLIAAFDPSIAQVTRPK